MSQDNSENWKRLEGMMENKIGTIKKDLEIALKELKLQNLEPTTVMNGLSGKKEEGHKTKKDEIDCPDCYKELRPLFYAKEDFKNKKYQCSNCGVPVNEEEAECPSCHGKEAKPRR